MRFIWSPRTGCTSSRHSFDPKRVKSLHQRRVKAIVSRDNAVGFGNPGSRPRRTNTMPVRHARSETRGRQPSGRRGGIGKNDSTRTHNGSGSGAAAIPVHATSPNEHQVGGFVTRSQDEMNTASRLRPPQSGSSPTCMRDYREPVVRTSAGHAAYRARPRGIRRPGRAFTPEQIRSSPQELPAATPRALTPTPPSDASPAPRSGAMAG
jgi:hypothetical protein